MDIHHPERAHPKLSVLCPSYNHEPYLRQALDSILMQETDFLFEVLVGEDCSPDRSRDILREYETRYPGFFQMFYRETNLGGTRNGYDLYMRARGEYIIVLETDDYWTDPHKLQKQVDFLDTHPAYIGCAHDCKTVDEFGDAVCLSCWNIPDQGERFTLQDFLRYGFAIQTASFMYRNPFQDGGDYSILYKAHPLVGDLTLLSILLQRGDIYLLPDCMSAYRRVIKKGGTSAASRSAANKAVSLESSMKQLVMLEAYFQGKIDYSLRKRYPVERYLSGWLRREAGFTAAGMRYMWNHAGPAVQKEMVLFALGYPVRKVKKYWNKIWKRERVNG